MCHDKKRPHSKPLPSGRWLPQKKAPPAGGVWGGFCVKDGSPKGGDNNFPAPFTTARPNGKRPYNLLLTYIVT